MLVEKLKWLAFTFTTACLVLFAAGSGLVARARTGQENVAAGPAVQVKIEERRVPDFQKPVRIPEPVSPDPRRADNAVRDRELEASANSVENLRVNAELLEMETALLKQDIQRLIGTVNQYEDMDPRGGGGPGGGRPSNAEYLKLLKSKLESKMKDYMDKRLELARLKRQIARESKTLDQPGGQKADLAEISQRLGALEKKVEKILQLLSTKE